ncbi:MAG: hypothetical protein HY650_10470 [Acidobacteria bacterium]|nr:hypothetical protein [Acidobacteriota bacterium]
MTYLMRAIEKFLTTHNRGAYIHILVVGNEPMFEVPDSDADKYEAYLQFLIDRVDALRTANAGWTYEIFTGALNRASELGAKVPPHPILQKIITITKENTKVSGIDLHLSYFDAQPWYPKNWFTTMFNMFQRYGLYAVTYGLESPPKIPAALDLLDEKSTLWVLNFIYNGTLLGTSADGYYNTNPLVFPDFVSHMRNGLGHLVAIRDNLGQGRKRNDPHR